ncbi:hypothetical protein ACFY3U_01795 [Micromonospora sp. NPDC000089]|uniref:hypothetical protein n=1 Tax=unclassified Micromonospora TaxID=2617518 RepID=UPI0036C6199C
MRRVGSRATAKACIVAAIPIGTAGFLLPDAWAVASIIASIGVLAAGGGLWWRGWSRDRRWLKLHRTADRATGGVGAVRGDVPQPEPVPVERPRGRPDRDWGEPPEPGIAERRRRRYRLTLSATSRVRRIGAQRRDASDRSPVDDRLMLVADDLAEIQDRIESAQERSRRDQLWWLVAGLAASVPIGVAINLVTG